MPLPRADVPLAEITAVIENFKNEAIYTMRRKAQKMALLSWRDAEVAPGVAARFTDDGAKFYGFSKRMHHYRKGKDFLPDYVKTGSFRDALADRSPRSANTGAKSGEVVTTLSIDGGPLNALSGVRGHTAAHAERVAKIVRQPAYVRVQKGKEISVSGSEQRRMETHITYTMATRSYRDEFQITQADMEYIQRKDEEYLREIVRSAAFTKTGKLKVSVVEKFRGTTIADGDE